MRIAQFTGWSFEFVEAEGDNANERALRLLEMLDNGEVDIEGSMSYSAALAETYEYPENSYGSAHTALFAPNIHAAVSKTDLFTRSELRVAILATAKKRRAELEYYCDQNGINLVTVECSTTQELLDKILNRRSRRVPRDRRQHLRRVPYRVVVRWTALLLRRA